MARIQAAIQAAMARIFLFVLCLGIVEGFVSVLHRSQHASIDRFMLRSGPPLSGAREVVRQGLGWRGGARRSGAKVLLMAADSAREIKALKEQLLLLCEQSKQGLLPLGESKSKFDALVNSSPHVGG